MIEHTLKCAPESFEAVISGAKTHDLRVNDRNFQVGDCLILKEWITTHDVYDAQNRPLDAIGSVGYFSGRQVRVTVTYITPGGRIEAGRASHVVMSIRAERVNPPASTATPAEKVQAAGEMGAAIGGFLKHFVGPRRPEPPRTPKLGRKGRP